MFTYAMGEKGRRCMYVLYVCSCVHVGSSMHACLTQREETQLSLLIFCNLPSILIKKKRTHKYIFTQNDWTQQKGYRREHVGIPPKTRRKRQEIKFAFAFVFVMIFVFFFLFSGYVDITKSGILHTHNLSR